MDYRVRRARRSDLRAILTLVERQGLPLPPLDRAALKRFRNIVADLGGDFDVAATRNRIRGIVHLAYTRELSLGNRAQLLALVADSSEVHAALLETAVVRAVRRQCLDLIVLPGPWISPTLPSQLPPAWQCEADTFRIDLSGRRGAECPGSSAARR